MSDAASRRSSLAARSASDAAAPATPKNVPHRGGAIRTRRPTRSRAVRRRRPARRRRVGRDDDRRRRRARARRHPAGCTTTPAQRYDYLSDVTAVEFRDLEQPIEVVWHLRSLPFRRFLRVKVLIEKRRDARGAERVGHLQERGLARARVLRHVRHHVRRPSRSAPHPDVGAVQGRAIRCERTFRCAAGSAAPSSCARRSRRIRKRATRRKSCRSPTRSRICRRTCGGGSAPANGRESSMATTKRTVEVELSTTGLDAQGRPRRVPLVVDESGAPVAVAERRRRSSRISTVSTCSSTSGRSIRRRTACCAWCSSSTARRSCAASRTSAICTAASRRSASTASTIRSSRGPTVRII